MTQFHPIRVKFAFTAVMQYARIATRAALIVMTIAVFSWSVRGIRFLAAPPPEVKSPALVEPPMNLLQTLRSDGKWSFCMQAYDGISEQSDVLRHWIGSDIGSALPGHANEALFPAVPQTNILCENKFANGKIQAQIISSPSDWLDQQRALTTQGWTLTQITTLSRTTWRLSSKARSMHLQDLGGDESQRFFLVVSDAHLDPQQSHHHK